MTKENLPQEEQEQTTNETSETPETTPETPETNSETTEAAEEPATEPAEETTEAEAKETPKAETKEEPKAETTEESDDSDDDDTETDEAELDAKGVKVIKEEEATDVVKRSINDDDEIEAEAPEEFEVEEIGGAHDEYDWDAANENIAAYDDATMKEMEAMYDSTLKTIEENEIVIGKVVGITNTDVVLNIGFKSDGLVSLNEFRDVEELKKGDEFDVYVVEKEDLRGQLVLSRKNAKLIKAWDNIVDAYQNETVVVGRVTSKTKGGLIADVFGLETFLPGSQIDVKPIVDYDQYVGQKMEFKVVKINEAIKNAVVSHKALIESDLESQRQEIMGKLEKGQVLEGTIKNITDFGAFIDLGGVDGLLYITDISWGRINHPSEVLELNQKLNVVVLDFDDEKKRISLGLKQLQPHPWDVLDDKLEVGSTIKGKIVNIEDYGAFLEITPGVEGLIHVSEVSWSNHPVNSKEFFNLGDTYEAVIMTLNRDERKMSLSIKRLLPDPWDKIEEKYAVGTKHDGLVQNITPYGVFVELEDGIGGMIHISDLSWTKRFAHPSEFTKVGETLEVVILEIDKEERKLTLGHKQIEEDPWDTFESIFPEGSVHEGTVVRRDDAGAIVQLQYGLEGFCPNKHLKKEDGSSVQVDEKVEFKVLEFDRKDKRIILSHTRLVSDVQFEEDKKEAKKKEAQKTKTQKAVRSSNSKVEKTTLGDLDVLSQLKEQMEEAESKPAKKTAAKKTTAKKSTSKKTKKDEDAGDEEE